MTLKMASAKVVETSVANNSPSQDSSHPDNHFQLRYVTPGSNHFLIHPSLWNLDGQRTIFFKIEWTILILFWWVFLSLYALQITFQNFNKIDSQIFDIRRELSLFVRWSDESFVHHLHYYYFNRPSAPTPLSLMLFVGNLIFPPPKLNSPPPGLPVLQCQPPPSPDVPRF